MGTSNFMFTHRLDVIPCSVVANFDIDAYNDGLPEEDHINAGNYEAIADITSIYTRDFIDEIKSLAAEPWENRSTQNPYLKQKASGFLIESTTNSVSDRCGYYDRNYGGTGIAEITAETVFFGERIQMEMAVILRHGYYDGANIDQNINITIAGSGNPFEDYTDDQTESAVDFVVKEYALYGFASTSKMERYRKGIEKRLTALEKVLWQRYEQLVSSRCEQYRVIGRFSNGETLYQSAA